MLILGLQGSPRKGGNTDTFLKTFMEAAEGVGAAVNTIQVSRAGIEPCKGCGYCETHGRCVIAEDPMSTEIYGLIREADMVVAASPVYFYGISAQLKVLIDRCQTLWARKHIYKLKDPLADTRKGVLFSVAASKGRQLFTGVQLTANYFFDAIDARGSHELCYRGVEAKGAISNQPHLAADIEALVQETVRPLTKRKRVLFVSRQGACRAPLAAALAQGRYNDRIRTDFAARSPADELNEHMLQAMQRNGVDMGYRRPRAIDQAVVGTPPDLTIIIGESVERRSVPGKKTLRWSLDEPDVCEQPRMEELHAEIASRVETILPLISS